jgi:hypothetical protein
VTALYCSCEGQHPIWGEFWWVEGKYQWIFFDDQERSETSTERLIQCPACGQRLKRMNHDTVKG